MRPRAALLAAALPPALALGPGAEARIPMSAAVIGGMIASTFLTLFAVPAAYGLLSRFERKQYRAPRGVEEGLAVPAHAPVPLN